MRITTKTGDSGLTSLLHGGRVKKDSLRIESCGELDELNSFLGLSKSLLKNRETKRMIEKVQRDLIMLCAEVASDSRSVHRLKKRITSKNVEILESFIERMERRGGARLSSFTLPGKNVLSAGLDVARSIARRAERRITTLRNKRMLKNNHILIYLNRLSDLLYLMARSCEKNRRWVIRGKTR